MIFSSEVSAMPRSSVRFALIALAAVVAASTVTASQARQSPAPQSKPKTLASSARQCFDANNVTSFAPVDDRHVNLRVGVKQVYQATLFAPCYDIDWAWRLGVRQRNGGSFICSGLDADIIVPDRNFPQRCHVTGFRLLSPEEVKALPPKQRP
jgi:Family of unknown function (DUF6491)